MTPASPPTDGDLRGGIRRRGRSSRAPLGAGLAMAFALFIMLGMPEGSLGAAWPSMRLDLGRPVSSLAWMVIGYTVGYLVATSGNGWLLEWFGVDRVLVAGVTGTVIGVTGYALSPWWWLVVGISLITGAGAGTVDATLNTFVAITAGVRAMNLLHAFFGVGATIGPLAVTAALGADASWRLVYGAIALIEISLLATVIARRHRFQVTVRPTDDTGVAGPPMPRALLALGLVFFAGYVAAEVSLGQWSYSLLVDERGVSTTVAGAAIAAYWGGLTVGRLLLAVAGSRFAPVVILRWSSLATVSGVALFWLDPAGVGLAALPLVGLAQAGMFPAMVLLNPHWLGPHNTGRAVGLQLMASSAGAIGASVVIGAAVRQWGLEAMPPVVTGLTVTTLLAFTAAARLAAHRDATGSSLQHGRS